MALRCPKMAYELNRNWTGKTLINFLKTSILSKQDKNYSRAVLKSKLIVLNVLNYLMAFIKTFLKYEGCFAAYFGKAAVPVLWIRLL